MSVELRDMVEADIAPLDVLLRAAYENAGSSEARLRAALTSGAARTFVAADGDTLAGMATLHDFDALGYVALVAVAPAFQRRGIARRIMDAIVEDSTGRGHLALALEASTKGKPLYDGMGFSALGSTLVCEGRKPAPAARDPRVREATRDDCDLICAYDAVAFGGDRSATLRQYFADPARRIVVADDGEQIGGYAVSQGARVAPLIARTPGAAVALADAACAFIEAETVRIFVPEENLAAVALAAQRGWKPLHRLVHMALGTPFYFPRRAVYGLMSLGEG